MDKPTYDIAEKVIKLFGGHKQAAELMRIDITTVYRWTYPRAVNGGTDGLIPVRHHGKIIRLSNKLHLGLKRKDLFPQE